MLVLSTSNMVDIDVKFEVEKERNTSYNQCSLDERTINFSSFKFINNTGKVRWFLVGLGDNQLEPPRYCQ